MISLFLDTSSKKLCVFLVKDNDILFYKDLETNNDHSRYLVPFIDEALTSNNLKPSDVDKVFVVNGPGSFTGTRIAVTVGKTFAYSNNINVVPVSSLKQFIFNYSGYDYYVSTLKDKGNRLYYGIYDKDYKDIITDKYNTIDVYNEDVNKLDGNIVYILDGKIDNVNDNEPKLDILKLIDYYKDQEINPHYLKPNYLKHIEAEDKL
jgi:tRNA threonylcarbamoyladenosine biosynthesis protein TsaB